MAEFDHKGITITFNADTGYFYIPDARDHYETYKQACDAVDRSAANQRKVAHKKMALAIFTEEGTAETITGIHSSNFSLLITPKHLCYHASNRYPDVPQVRTQVAKLLELQKQVAIIESHLRKFKIEHDSWTLKSAGDIEAAYVALEREYNKKKAAAERTTL